jgi:hypothetical protein
MLLFLHQLQAYTIIKVQLHETFLCPSISSLACIITRTHFLVRNVIVEINNIHIVTCTGGTPHLMTGSSSDHWILLALSDYNRS